MDTKLRLEFVMVLVLAARLGYIGTLWISRRLEVG
jgi:hypothetical protein